MMLNSLTRYLKAVFADFARWTIYDAAIPDISLSHNFIQEFYIFYIIYILEVDCL